MDNTHSTKDIETSQDHLFCSKTHMKGLTLVELLLIVAIIGTLLSVAVPSTSNMIHRARVSKACSDITVMNQKLTDHLMDYGELPETLQGVDPPILTDPWGNPYQYLVILGKSKSDISGKWRKDRFLVPLNYDFDLYSMGKDGESVAPLTSDASYDDIIRANNGDYIGLASKY